MKIIIAGAGRIGSTVAKDLASQKNDVTVIDKNHDVANNLAGDIDAICIEGSASDLDVLKSADVDSADLFLAVTDNDELNMVSSLCAKNLGAKNSIARIRNIEYSNKYSVLRDIFGLSLIINPERECASEIVSLLMFPGAVKMLTFANGNVEMSDYIIPDNSVLDNIRLCNIKTISNADILICAVSRNNDVYIPDGNFTLLKGDRISILGGTADQKRFYESINAYRKPVKSVMILGGNRISLYLCRMLNNLNVHTTVIEKNGNLCDSASRELPNSKIIFGDGMKSSVLLEEGLLSTDAFISMTDDDGENLITSMYAHDNNVPIIITKVDHEHFSGILKSSGLHSVIIPKKIVSDKIVACVEAISNSIGSSVVSMYRFENERAEALEFRLTNRDDYLDIPIKKLNIKNNILIGAVVRNNQVIIPNGNTVLKYNDDVIIISKSGLINDFRSIFDESKA